MSDSVQFDEPRRFICGNCCNEFQSFDDLTFHADLCFSTCNNIERFGNSPNQIEDFTKSTVVETSIRNERQQSIIPGITLIQHPYSRFDETASAVETLVAENHTSENTFRLGDHSSSDRSRTTAQNRSIERILCNNQFDRFGGDLHLSIDQEIDLSTEQYRRDPMLSIVHHGQTDLLSERLGYRHRRIIESITRFPEKKISLAGIRVTPGFSGAEKGPATEYRGAAARRSCVGGPATGAAHSRAAGLDDRKIVTERLPISMTYVSSLAQPANDQFSSDTDSDNRVLSMVGFTDQRSVLAPAETDADPVLSMVAPDQFPSTFDGGPDAEGCTDAIINSNEFTDQSDEAPSTSALDLFPVQPHPHNVKYKEQSTKPKEKWLYLPADSGDLRSADGKLKKSYRIHCPVCERILWRQNLQQHMRTHTGDRPYKCDQCSKAFAGVVDLKRHTTTHEDRSRRLLSQCPFCQWVGLGNLRRHVRTQHNGAEYDPRSIGAISIPVLPGHEMTRSIGSMETTKISKAEMVVEEVVQAVNSGTFQSPIDEDLWEEALESVEQELRLDPSEILRTWNPPRIECDSCWKIVKRNNFAEHRRMHEPPGRFECNICSKTFQLRIQLARHVREHNNLGEWTCRKCWQKFPTSIELKRHRLAAHQLEKEPQPKKPPSLPWKLRKTICHICGLMITQSKISTHLKMHTEGVQEYGCDQCSKKYRSSYFLRLHKARVHDGNLPYKCLKCDFCARRRNHIVKHMLEVHNDLVDNSTSLIRGVSTLKHYPTRRCSICDVHIFLDNFDTHLKKHSDPVAFEKLRKERLQQFRGGKE